MDISVFFFFKKIEELSKLVSVAKHLVTVWTPPSVSGYPWSEGLGRETQRKQQT